MSAPVDAMASPRADEVGNAARREPHRWRWAALILIGSLLLVAAALLRPGGTRQADQTEHRLLANQTGLPGLQPGTGLEQRFVADADGLSQVSVRFGTFAQTGTGTVVAQLDTDQGEPVAVGTVSVADIRDAYIRSVIEMDPQAGSAGRTYRLRLSLSDDATIPVTVFGVEPTATEPAARRTDGQPPTAAFELHTDYGRDDFAFEQLGAALSRMGDYGPFWRTGGFVVLLALAAIALLAGVALAPRRRGLVVLLLFVLVKGVLWSVIIPPLLGADESGHVAYAQYLAVDHAIPKRGSPQGSLGPYSEEIAAANRVFHPIDVPRSDRADYGPSSEEARRQLEEARGDDHSNGDGPAAGYTPAYYAVPAVLYDITPGRLDVRIGAMRLWSVALGVLTVFFTVRLGRLVFPGKESAALVLGAAVALHPMLSQQTAVLTNDAGVIAAGAACAWLAVLLVMRDRSRWIPAAAGFAFGMGLLAKPLGIAFVPAIFAAWVIGRRRGGRPAPWWWEALTAAAGVVATFGVWVVFSTLFGYAGVGIQDRTGGPPRGVHTFIEALQAHSYGPLWANWIDQFWGNFGPVDTPYPGIVLGVVFVAVVVGLVLVAAWIVVFARDLVLAVRGRGPLLDPEQADQAAAMVVLLLIIAGTVAELSVLTYGWYIRVGDFGFVQGRYALMIVPVVLAAPVLALRRLAPRLSALVPLGVVAAAMGTLNVIAIGLIVERFYL